LLAENEGNKERYGVEKKMAEKKNKWEIRKEKICLIHSEDRIGGGIKGGGAVLTTQICERTEIKWKV